MFLLHFISFKSYCFCLKVLPSAPASPLLQHLLQLLPQHLCLLLLLLKHGFFQILLLLLIQLSLLFLLFLPSVVCQDKPPTNIFLQRKQLNLFKHLLWSHVTTSTNIITNTSFLTRGCLNGCHWLLGWSAWCSL